MEEDVQGTATTAYRPTWGTCDLCHVSVPKEELRLMRTEAVGIGQSEFVQLCQACRREIEAGEYLPVEDEADEPLPG